MFVEHDEGMHGVYWLNDYIMSNEQCIIKSCLLILNKVPFVLCQSTMYTNVTLTI